jgi:hypothetical protein
LRPFLLLKDLKPLAALFAFEGFEAACGPFCFGRI